MNDDRRLAEWVDLTGDLLQQPRPEFPREQIAWQLTRTFEVLAVSHDWRDAAGNSGSRRWPEVDTSPVSDLPHWHLVHIISRHPLVRWFRTTQDPTPQSIGRVPLGISPKRDREFANLYLKPIGADQQLSLPYVINGHSYGAFVLGRSGDDYSDNDLELARRLQRLIRGLYLHTLAASRAHAPLATCEAAARAHLTATELEVLLLLGDGGTAQAIAHRLDVSPRTVQKHLEHVYRKLGVQDRLSAVLTAREAGLLPARIPSARRIPEQRRPG